MTRTVYLLVFNSPLFPAHWALWIPHTNKANTDVGTYIHATGDAASGFEVAFERNFDLGIDTRRHQKIALAEILDQHVVDFIGDGDHTKDQIARDCLEEVALEIPASGRSLVSVSQGRKERVAIRNCQTWLRDAVAAFVQVGIMDQSALKTVDNAPKN